MTEETTFASKIEAGKSWRHEDMEMQSDLNEDKSAGQTTMGLLLNKQALH